MTNRNWKSRALAGIALGTAAFALAACEDEVETAVLERDFDCNADASLPFGMTPDECADLVEDALEEHRRTAPRYDAIAVCEEQHGEGNCQAAGGGGGSVFLPLFAGYMIGNMLNNGNRGAYRARPLVSGKSGGYLTTDGRTRVNGLGGMTRLSSRSLTTTPPTTFNKPPMTRAAVSARGGFGSARTGGSFRGG